MRTGRAEVSFKASYVLLGLTVLAAALCGVLYSRAAVHTREVLEFEVRHDADRVISEAVDRALKDAPESCVTVSRAADGSVTSAETDPAASAEGEN